MRILFIHEVNYRNKVIFEMHEFPELLALRGHDVAFLHYPEFPDRPRVSLRTVRERLRGRVHPEATIDLITPPTLGGGSFERYLAPLLGVPALRREIRAGGYDVVVLYAVPTTGWQAVGLARRAGVPIVYRALDVSHRIRSSLLAPLIRLAERYINKNVTLVSANNPAMARYCVEMSGRTGPSEVNLPPIDLSHFEARAGKDIRAELGLNSSHKVILYMGSFFEFSGLDVLIDRLESEFARYPNLRLVLIGGGDLDARLRETVKERNLSDRVLFTGVVPYAQLPDYLKTADVALNPFRSELVTNVALPHKVLQYMAAGVPVVSTDLDGLHGVLGDESGVTLIKNSSLIASAAAELAHAAPEVLSGIAARQSDYVTRTFSMESAVASFESTLESVR